MPVKKKQKSRTAIKPGNDAIRFRLRLYITGSTPRSMTAVKNLTKFCSENFEEYDLEVVDIYQQPARASEAQILAAPTLVKHLPLPIEKFVCDLSNLSALKERVNESKFSPTGVTKRAQKKRRKK